MRLPERWTVIPGWRCDTCGGDKFFGDVSAGDVYSEAAKGVFFVCADYDCDGGMVRSERVNPQLKNPQDVLQTLPEGHGERKGVPIVTGVLDYFPLAIAYVARISKLGNDQHNPGEPLHWARGKSSDHADCVGRHLMQRGTFDADTFADGERVRHTGKAAWRVLALLQEELEAEAGFTPKGDA